MSTSVLLRPGLAICPSGGVWIEPWVLIGGGVIEALGEGPPPPIPAETEVHDHSELVLLPGFVNAHTHLELTPLAGRLSPTCDFWQWIIDLVALRDALGERNRQGGEHQRDREISHLEVSSLSARSAPHRVPAAHARHWVLAARRLPAP